MSTNTPAYKIVVNGQDKTGQLHGKLISLILTDNPGFDIDRLTIRIDDSEGNIALPKPDAVIQLWLGLQGEPLIDKGKYTVDEAGHSGPPDIITIKASSTGFDPAFKTQRQFAWHDVTLGDIITTIAKRYRLTDAIGSDLKNQRIQHIDQTNESDAHFLTRLAEENDAIATIKNENLLFIARGQSKTVSGIELPEITIERKETQKHVYREAERNGKYTGVKARWLDTDIAKAQYVLAGEGGTVKTLTKTYPSEPEAYHAADAELKKTQRGGILLQIIPAQPMLELIPENPVSLNGFKTAITSKRWFVKRITHRLNNGLGTTIELEPTY